MPRWTGYAEQSHVPEQPTLLQIIRAKQDELVRAALAEQTEELADRRARKEFAANRDLCAGWSIASGKRCELFAQAGSEYCRYHGGGR